MREKINNVVLRGVAACVPGRMVGMDELYAECPDEASKKKLIRAVTLSGLDTRYVAKTGTTGADLAERAGRTLLEALNWPHESVDVLLMATNCPDSLLPSTGYLLHQRLGLSSHCVVIDAVMACFAVTHGLWNIAGMLSRGTAVRALILTGDTLSKDISPGDLATKALMGDAGGAVALEYRAGAGDISFMLGTHDAGVNAIRVPGRGYRPSAEPPYFVMDGVAVASMTYSLIPPLLDELVDFSGEPLDSIDRFYLHQANASMLSVIINRSRLPKTRPLRRRAAAARRYRWPRCATP